MGGIWTINYNVEAVEDHAINILGWKILDKDSPRPSPKIIAPIMGASGIMLMIGGMYKGVSNIDGVDVCSTLTAQWRLVKLKPCPVTILDILLLWLIKTLVLNVRNDHKIHHDCLVPPGNNYTTGHIRNVCSCRFRPNDNKMEILFTHTGPVWKICLINIQQKEGE